MQVRLFGELRVAVDGGPVPIRGVKQRTLLAMLALAPGQPVGADRLIDVLWRDAPVAHPGNALQAQIGQLRRVLGTDAIRTTAAAGYALDVAPDDVDVVRFERLVTAGRRLAAEGDAGAASATLLEALELRTAEPLAEFAFAGFADEARARLDELLLVAVETRAAADLELGRHTELVGELQAWVRRHPLRERLLALLILALYKSGRQSEALGAYAEGRNWLADELGVDPGPELRELEMLVLTHDSSLDAVAPTAAITRPTSPNGNLRERLTSLPAGQPRPREPGHRPTGGWSSGGRYGVPQPADYRYPYNTGRRGYPRFGAITCQRRRRLAPAQIVTASYVLRNVSRVGTRPCRSHPPAAIPHAEPETTMIVKIQHTLETSSKTGPPILSPVTPAVQTRHVNALTTADTPTIPASTIQASGSRAARCHRDRTTTDTAPATRAATPTIRSRATSTEYGPTKWSTPPSCMSAPAIQYAAAPRPTPTPNTAITHDIAAPIL